MALNSSSLKAAIKASVASKLSGKTITVKGNKLPTYDLSTVTLDDGNNWIDTLIAAIADAVSEETVSHIVTNMEISGITVSDPSTTVETYAAGVGANGGSLVAGAYPVVGNVVKGSQTLSQSNSGTGRVS